MSSLRRVHIAIAVLLALFGLSYAEDENKEYYPLSWTKIDYKSIVDNDRLFKKYKDCFISDKPSGCPRDVTQFKKIIPEIIDSLCAKCLPEHIEKLKEAAEYICKRRRADFDEVRKLRDPTGEIQAKFEAKFGKVNC